jgi:hypothetical protein
MKFDVILKTSQVVMLAMLKAPFAIINSFAIAAQLPSRQACKVDVNSRAISSGLKRKDASLANPWIGAPISQNGPYSASKLVRITPIYDS